MKANNTASLLKDGKELNTFTRPASDMQAERDRTSFPVREMTHFFNNGKENTEFLEKLFERIQRDPAFNNKDFYDLDYKPLRQRTFEQIGRMWSYLDELGADSPLARRFLSPFGMINPSAQTRVSVHYGLFVSALRGQGTDKQYEFWKSQGCLSLNRFYGCFGMTELGHGSNVAELETTATFDRATDEFIIHTPNTAATKWWIGGAAHSSNHTVCFARLIVDGKDYGVRNFVVPLRDPESHNLLPGIAVGDIGKKMGRDGIDNGWIQFSNVRIPRTYMLMRYSQVTPEGKVIEPPLAQLTYGALINGRVAMAYDSWVWARRFLTIALRYAAVRRQFSSTEGREESKLLDYVLHQRRLIPLLAQAIGIEAAATELYRLFDEVTHHQASLDTSDRKAVSDMVDKTKELFSLSAGLKAFSTWATVDTIDECRQACGGLGYLSATGFGQGFDDWVVNCTWEGDNNVLCLSAGRSLIQSGCKVLDGKHVTGAADYLGRIKTLRGKSLASGDLRDPKVLVGAWESVAAQAVMDAAEAYKKLRARGVSDKAAFEELSIDRFNIARLHTRCFQIKALFRKIANANPSIQKVLTNVGLLFALWSIEKNGSPFLQYGFLTSDDMNKVIDLVTFYCGEVRDQVIGITDSFNISDFFLNSPIGNYDGNAYENLMDSVTERNVPGTPCPYQDAMNAFFKRTPYEQPRLDEI
ncbi:Acyl-coenzyme A oxidase 2 [Wickerhamiella sorbophila]|uniref:Acyl-coenzyme A oxidase n=1 Tax=Wickerhamiella sorbophila TaxID=45607 RepID=A0A2T0FNI3_9ASCO|nr:Acyl-coenzyme A oxidase 2 [Wickerhamiella sorbophila]PRT56540.1 Acyl-coenzyme A oxidase 2 [Wickerhamiella sorbophila]